MFNPPVGDTKWTTTLTEETLTDGQATITLKSEISTPPFTTPARSTSSTASRSSAQMYGKAWRPTPTFTDSKPDTKELLNATMKWEAAAQVGAQSLSSSNVVRDEGKVKSSGSTYHHHHAVSVRNIPRTLSHHSYCPPPPPTVSHCPHTSTVSAACQACCCTGLHRPAPPPPSATWATTAAGHESGEFLLFVDDGCALKDCGENK